MGLMANNLLKKNYKHGIFIGHRYYLHVYFSNFFSEKLIINTDFNIRMNDKK